MTQPDSAPISERDRVRPIDRLSINDGWVLSRPAEQVDLEPPRGARFGATGPDLGFGLKLAKRFEDRLELAPGESAHDAVAGCFACGSRRSADFGRAPVIHDMEWAYTLWGYLGGAPEDLVAARVKLFRGASHEYWDQRQVVDAVNEATLRMTPAQVRSQLSSWQSLVSVA